VGNTLFTSQGPLVILQVNEVEKGLIMRAKEVWMLQSKEEEKKCSHSEKFLSLFL